jgi:hypothetical protein
MWPSVTTNLVGGCFFYRDMTTDKDDSLETNKVPDHPHSQIRNYVHKLVISYYVHRESKLAIAAMSRGVLNFFK